MVTVSAPRDDRGIIDYSVQLHSNGLVPRTRAIMEYSPLNGDKQGRVVPGSVTGREPLRAPVYPRENPPGADHGRERRRRQLPVYLDTRLKPAARIIDLRV